MTYRQTLIASVMLVAAGCGILSPGGGPRSDLEENRERWEAFRPTSYSVTIERLCFCGVEARGPVQVTVQGTEVIERVYTDSGEPVAENLAHVFPGIDGLFDFLLEALDGDAHEIRVTYDQGTGIPTDVWIDYDENMIDEEQGFSVTLPLVTHP